MRLLNGGLSFTIKDPASSGPSELSNSTVYLIHLVSRDVQCSQSCIGRRISKDTAHCECSPIRITVTKGKYFN